jgi:undecaprenyl-phosphate galactose phosphotransferase
MSSNNSTRFLLSADILAVVLAFLVGQSLRLFEFQGSLSLWWQLEGQFRIYGLLIATVGVFISFGFFLQHYSQRKPFWDELREVLGALFILMIVDAAFFFFNKMYFSRLAFAVQWLVLIPLLPTLRTIFKLRG